MHYEAQIISLLYHNQDNTVSYGLIDRPDFIDSRVNDILGTMNIVKAGLSNITLSNIPSKILVSCIRRMTDNVADA